MRIVIQRVSEASVSIKDKMKSSIQQGFLILLGIGEDDTEDDIEWLVKKVVNLRVFDDEQGVMNKSILDVNGNILVVSQFTLMASYKGQPTLLHSSRRARDFYPTLSAVLQTFECPIGKRGSHWRVWC